MAATKLVSIIVPVYNEAFNIPALCDEIFIAISGLSYDFELIFVDDGSVDGSPGIIADIVNNNSGIHLIRFTRNFGKEAAVSAGIHAARGDAAIMIDADLQMPPSILGDFIAKWERGAEVVVGVFASRSMSRIKRWGASIFYAIMRRISHTQITPHATDYRLIDRQVINKFNKFSEHNRITRGLIDWLGFRREYVYFNQRPRRYGEPAYSLKKLGLNTKFWCLL